MKTTLAAFFFFLSFCRGFLVFCFFFSFFAENWVSREEKPLHLKQPIKKKKKIQSSDEFWEKKQPQSGKRLQISTLQFVFSPR